MLAVKHASLADLEIVRDLAYRTWPVSYAGIISDTQIGYMLELIYSIPSLIEQVEIKGHQFDILTEEEIPVGFVSYCRKPGHNKDIFRLNKIYVLPNLHGKGIGKFLLDHVIAQVSNSGASALELNVNKNNPAMHFYVRNGFQMAGEEVLDIGSGYVMDDYVMLKRFEN